MKTVAIFSPMIDPVVKKFNMDFVLRLKKTSEELTLESLYHLAKNSYNTNKTMTRNNNEIDTISAAGYYLTSLLRRNNYKTVMTANIDEESLNRIAKQNPIAFCISTTMILEKESLATIINQIRKYMKDVIIIVGGILVWKSFLWSQKIDSLTKNNKLSNDIVENNGTVFPCNKVEIDADVFVVSYHGGNLLLRILDEIIKNGNNYNLGDIPNLALPDINKNFYFTRRDEEENNYDEDYTRWELVDELPYRIPIRTSIGCPYRCGYCDFCYLYPKIRFRSLDSIKAELNTIKQLLVNDPKNKNRIINFSDDNIFITSKRATDICNTLIKVNSGLSWSGFLRASSINSSNINLIKSSGLKAPWIGVESGDQEQLIRMNKKQSIDTVKNGIELLDNEDISVHMSYIIGYLGETDVSVNNTINFLNNLNVTNSVYKVYPLLIFPMSEISMPVTRKEWEVKGIFREWSHKTMDSKIAAEKCKFLFKKVINVPYSYSQENGSFLQKYNSDIRRNLFSLRQQLTVSFMEQSTWEKISQLFSEISMTMGIDSTPPSFEFGKEISYPN